ncbi:MAG: tetratricopeptide repeat protein [Balneolaceae bacterium]
MRTNNKIFIVSLYIFCVLIVTACTESPQLPDLPEGAQAISFLGDTLMKPEIHPDQIDEFERDLKNATEKYRFDPEDPDAIIWMGRRSAYLAEYRDAVRIFTEGIYKHPENPEMYRHRGHRYITLRMPDHAIRDLEMAASLVRDQNDKIEEDGLPNPLNLPRTTLHFNIWYHLGLAHYIKGDFKSAADAYEKCLNVSTNDDMIVATVYWYYMALRRSGQDEKAGRLLLQISEEMEVIENHSYHDLLLAFKGLFSPDRLLDSSGDALQNSTIGYGIGNWHYINGREERAFSIWRNVLETGNWPAFGYIAAEAEL